MGIRLRIRSCEFQLNNMFFASLLLVFVLLIYLMSEIETSVKAPQSQFWISYINPSPILHKNPPTALLARRKVPSLTISNFNRQELSLKFVPNVSISFLGTPIHSARPAAFRSSEAPPQSKFSSSASPLKPPFYLSSPHLHIYLQISFNKHNHNNPPLLTELLDSHLLNLLGADLLLRWRKIQLSHICENL